MSASSTPFSLPFTRRVMASGRKRSEGSVARRARRREVIQQRRMQQKEQQAKVKAEVGDYVSHGCPHGSEEWRGIQNRFLLGFRER